MENIKFIGAQNEIQKIYSDLGLIVPVGDLDNGKAPAIQPLPATSTQTSITAKFNVMSGAEISSLSYKVNDGAATSITPAKGVVTITLSDLEYNSGPYEIELTATNETGSTEASTAVALQHYTNWATPDEVLLGNRYIGEDGEAHVGEIVTKTATNVTFSNGNVNIPVGYYAEQVTKEYPIPIPVLETVPVTPTTSAQTITPSTGYDGIGTVNVSAVTSSIDANITADNIKDGVTILGVTGTFEGGPSTGGATIQSAVLTDDGQGYGTYSASITFDELPSDIDTTNHNYKAILYAQCYNYDAGDMGGHLHYAMISDIQNATYFDIEHNIIEEGYVAAPLDDQDQTLLSTPGYVILYEDSLINPIYKWPCTVTVTQP